MQPKSCLLPEPVILQAEGLSCSVSSWLHQVCLPWEPGVSKSISPTRLGVSEGHRVCAREGCVLRLASGRNLMFTSNTQEILTRRDRRVSGEDHLACSEVKASQDLFWLLGLPHYSELSSNHLVSGMISSGWMSCWAVYKLPGFSPCSLELASFS